MIKAFLLGIVAMAFVLVAGTAFAQTATPTATPTPTSTTSTPTNTPAPTGAVQGATTVPGGAPNTGRG